jgi:hypothetical protein
VECDDCAGIPANKICPYDKKLGFQGCECKKTFLTKWCTCAEDPCDACPTGLGCQRSDPPLCLDCNCGFCDKQGVACCKFNGVVNCHDGPGDNQDCLFQKENFPSFGAQSGNVCSGVELNPNATPNGCGCHPNKLGYCTYTPDLTNACYICRDTDLFYGEPRCRDCEACLQQQKSTRCFDTARASGDINQMKACLGSYTNARRNACNTRCQKTTV